MLNTISYQIKNDEKGFQILPVLDGKPFQEYCKDGYGDNFPLDGADLQCNPTMTVFDLPLRPYTKEAIVLVCACGEWGCGSTTVRMQVSDTTVTWDTLRIHPNNENAPDPAFEPMVYDRVQYESVCQQIHAAYLAHTTERLAQALLPLEQSHLDPEFRTNPDKLAALLHPDYTEIGASGRLHTRDRILEHLQTETNTPTYTITNFTVHPLPPNKHNTRLARTQYTLTATQPSTPPRQTHRTTLWLNSPPTSTWQMLFHQGTPIPTTPQ